VRKPLQEEWFKLHVGGQVFFQDVRRYLSQQDAAAVADLLEVHQLCILLSFRGQYGAGAQGELHGLVEAISAKIRRVRGVNKDLSPAWSLPKDERLEPRRDPWARRLLLAFAVSAGLALLLFAFFAISLKSEASALNGAATETRR